MAWNRHGKGPDGGYEDLKADEREFYDHPERFKRTICKHWREGTCKRGDGCGYAHGWMDIGTRIPEGKGGWRGNHTEDRGEDRPRDSGGWTHSRPQDWERNQGGKEPRRPAEHPDNVHYELQDAEVEIQTLRKQLKDFRAHAMEKDAQICDLETANKRLRREQNHLLQVEENVTLLEDLRTAEIFKRQRH